LIFRAYADIILISI